MKTAQGRRCVRSGGRRLSLRMAAFIIVISLLFAASAAACGQKSSNVKSAVIFFVRHGQTEANVGNILQGGGSDAPLTEEGKKTVTELGEALASVKFEHAYSSGLGRAKTTAQMILDENQAGSVKTAEVETDLNDIDFGGAENLTFSEAEEKYGPVDIDRYIGSADDPDAKSVTGGETKYQFCRRFSEGIDGILEESCGNGDGGAILVTAHSSAAYYLQQKFPDETIGGLDNASVTVIRIKDGKWTLLDLNDTNYASLPEKLEEMTV
jgi:broad specificity phosphatase PhoE